MNGHERIRNALSRQQVDRTPYQLIGEHIGYTLPFMKMFKEKTGQDSPGDYFDLDCRGVFLGTTKKIRIFPGIIKTFEMKTLSMNGEFSGGRDR